MSCNNAPDAQLQHLARRWRARRTLQAARALRHQGYDFALLDVNLPDGTGTDLLKEQFSHGHRWSSS